MRPFLHAVEFLTIARLRSGAAPATMRDVARAQAWFPVVGLLIGGVLLAFDRLATRALPAASVDVLLVVLLALLTGALHLDGLADAADGLLGGGTPERRLDIMRDVHRGSFAIVAVVSVLAMKWAGLAALPGEVRYEALLLAPCLARAAMLTAIAAFPYARVEGMGITFRAEHPRALMLGSTFTVIAAVALLGVGGIAVAAFAAGAALALGWWVTRLAGGMTGDTYGATVETGEALLWLFIAAMAGRGWVEALALG